MNQQSVENRNEINDSTLIQDIAIGATVFSCQEHSSGASRNCS